MLGRVFKELLITSENPRVVATLRILLNYHENTRFASRKRPDNLYTNYGFTNSWKLILVVIQNYLRVIGLQGSFFPLEFTQLICPSWDLRYPLKFAMELPGNAGTKCGPAVIWLPFHSASSNTVKRKC